MKPKFIQSYQRNFFKQFTYLLQNRESWYSLSLVDFKIKYRRTAIGPLWSVLSIVITAFLMSAVWGLIFKANIIEFIPYVYLGLCTWTLISSIVSEPTGLITAKYRGIIVSYPVPVFVFAFSA